MVLDVRAHDGRYYGSDCTVAHRCRRHIGTGQDKGCFY